MFRPYKQVIIRPTYKLSLQMLCLMWRYVGLFTTSPKYLHTQNLTHLHQTLCCRINTI